MPINLRICLATDLFELETVQPIILTAIFFSYITVLILSLMPTVMLRFSLTGRGTQNEGAATGITVRSHPPLLEVFMYWTHNRQKYMLN